MRKIKKLLKWMNGIGKPASTVMRMGLILSCISLVAALLILVYAGDISLDTYSLHHMAKELYTLPQVFLLISTLIAVILEENFPGNH